MDVVKTPDTRVRERREYSNLSISKDDLGNRNEMKAGKKELGFDSVDYA